MKLLTVKNWMKDLVIFIDPDATVLSSTKPLPILNTVLSLPSIFVTRLSPRKMILPKQKFVRLWFLLW
ncbi:MAG: hypothetical protein CVU42_15625 [Chloroflexi bacterium HGW-Chloroflexi-4]|nr:MAG: hypothetical protein CVU42_15625 [Chloroflexi bacterium HGW-Chloroflexi-4]